jgi:hypothetical protein
MRLLSGLLFVAGMLAVTSFTAAQPPGQPGKGGKGGFGGFVRTAPGTILSTTIQETLKMTDAQKKDLEALQKEVDEKLAKILTEDQQKQFKELKESRGGFGGGGFGGKGGDGKGGFGGKGGKGGFPGKGEKKE